LCRQGCPWAAVAGDNCVVIIIIIIACDYVEGVVVTCYTLVYDGQLADGAWCHNGVGCRSHSQRCCNWHPWRCGRHHPWRCGRHRLTLGDVGSGGCESGRPDMMVVSWRIASRCFSLVVAVVGIVAPSCHNRSAAASIVVSFSDVVGTWQWLGYNCHVSEKRKCRVDGI
jgi:hypothetical protein